MIHGHGGNIYTLAARLGCRPDQIVDVSSNINPLGPPPGLMAFLEEHMAAICALPEVDSGSTEEQMAGVLGVGRRSLLAGAGTTQFIYGMFEVLQSGRVLILGPTYADYADACRLRGLEPAYLLASGENRFQPDMWKIDRMAGQVDTVVICNPNNPTGVMIPRDALIDLCRRHCNTRFVIDESYLGFVPRAEEESMAASGLDNVIVLHSLSKLYRLPGLRIGFLIAAPPIVDRFRAAQIPWNLNSLAQAAVRYVATHTEAIERFVAQSRAYIIGERQRFLERLRPNARLKIHPSCTIFFLIQLINGADAPKVWDRFAREGILVRDCSNFYALGERFIRIAVNQPDINRRVAALLSEITI